MVNASDSFSSRKKGMICRVDNSVFLLKSVRSSNTKLHLKFEVEKNMLVIRSHQGFYTQGLVVVILMDS